MTQIPDVPLFCQHTSVMLTSSGTFSCLLTPRCIGLNCMAHDSTESYETPGQLNAMSRNWNHHAKSRQWWRFLLQSSSNLIRVYYYCHCVFAKLPKHFYHDPRIHMKWCILVTMYNHNAFNLITRRWWVIRDIMYEYCIEFWTTVLWAHVCTDYTVFTWLKDRFPIYEPVF